MNSTRAFAAIILAIGIITGCDAGSSGGAEKAGTIAIDKDALYVDMIKGQNTTRYIEVTNTGRQSVNWSLSADNTCFTFSPENGTLKPGAGVTAKIIMSTAGLQTGFHNACVTVTAGDAVLPVTVSVFVGNYMSGHRLYQDEIIEGHIILGGDILVPEGRTLTILPGTVIMVKGDTPDWEIPMGNDNKSGSVEFAIHGGTLNAVGTPDELIVVTATRDRLTPGSWYGIIKRGANSSVDLKYFCSRYSEYGIFVCSDTAPAAIENCMFAYTGFSALADFSPGSTCKNNTFIRSMRGVIIDVCSGSNNTTCDITNCLFYSNENIDVGVFGSNRTVNIINSNFIDTDRVTFKNLYMSNISVNDSTITADNCYGIKSIFLKNDENSQNNIIDIRNTSPSEINGAGCGFPVPLEE